MEPAWKTHGDDGYDERNLPDEIADPIWDAASALKDAVAAFETAVKTAYDEDLANIDSQPFEALLDTRDLAEFDRIGRCARAVLEAVRHPEVKLITSCFKAWEAREAIEEAAGNLVDLVDQLD